MNRNHIILSLLAILSLFNGCSKDNGEYPQDNLMQFTTAGVKQVKSIITDNNSFQKGDAFGVFAYYYRESNNTEKTVIFDNTKITFSGTDWSYDNKQYWISGNTYRFVAFYPYNESGNPESYRVESLSPNGGYQIADFRVRREVLQQEDLMASQLIERGPIRQEHLQSPVAFTFEHLLSNINFMIKRAPRKPDNPDQPNLNTEYDRYSDFTLTKVCIRGMKSSGTYISQGNRWITDGITADQTGYQKVFSGNEGLIDPNTEAKMVWTEGGLLMIPQDIPSGALTLEINYTMNYKAPKSNNTTQKVAQRTLSLPVSPLWSVGSRITYSVEITYNSEIRFSSIEVEPWTFYGNNEDIIVK